MSVLTKVFVVLLTVLSVALSMFVVAVFSQQQDWKASATDWQQAAMAAQAKERTLSANLALEKARAIEEHERDVAAANEAKAQLVAKEAKVTELERTLAEANSRLTVEQGQVTSVSDSARLIQGALNKEKEFSAQISKRNSELERGNIDLTDRVKELTASIEMAKAQVRALQQQIAGLDDSRRSGTPAGGAVAQIPGGSGIVEARVPSAKEPATPAVSAPIRGEVTTIQDNIASISVGSADGVANGMTFLIYRHAGSGGKPQFLGTLRITHVEANEAAGLIEQSEGDIRNGDSVRDEASFAMRG